MRARAKPYAFFAVFVIGAFVSLAFYRAADRLRRPSPARALATLSSWCRWGCRWLRLDISVDGEPPPGPCLFIANHRSYLDIPVLTGVLGGTFLSRADVAGWPLVGTVARLTHAVLVERDDARDRTRAARALMRRLRTASVIVFPEGTTTGATLPEPFASGAFRLVQRLDVPLVPVTLRYSDRRAYWVEDLTVGQHLKKRVFAGGTLRVQVHIGATMHGGDHRDAEDLAAAVHAAVCLPIEKRGEIL
jgi:1-acyl-sn-glycerol-3-phosphate acyltransferase